MMRRVFPLALMFTWLTMPLPADEHGATAQRAAEANRKLGRGINFGNTLEAPTEGAWGVRLKPEYFKAIKDAGFDSVRLPVKWSAHAEKTAPFTIDPKFAERVDWALAQALVNRLNIIVNVHHYDAMDAAPDEHLPRLLSIWSQIAARYNGHAAGVYFELYNEPHDQLTPEKWNAAIPKLLAAVRATNPTRPVLIGPGLWNSIRALEKLELPPDDHHLILTIHYYEPFKFTHQGASWVKGSAPWKGTKWSGTREEKAEVSKAFATAAAWAKKRDLPICLGEFGAYSGAEMEARSRWTQFVAREAERRGFSWSYWEFCAGFGAYDPKTDAWREPLKAALVPAK